MAEEYVTNPSQSEAVTLAKYQNPSNGYSEALVSEDGSVGTIRRNLENGDLYDSGPAGRINPETGEYYNSGGLFDDSGRFVSLPPSLSSGAELPPIPDPTVNFKNVQGESIAEDLRVKIRVPASYITSLTSGGRNQIANLKAIIFPYTPAISFEYKAEYSEQKPLHSNFTVNFYQRSFVSSIQITGKFTVENAVDARTYAATTHLLKALTKMKFGTDPDAGAPPPVCRLDAYGDYFLKNVPVAIGSFRVEYPDDIDYFVTQDGLMSVPVRSTIAINCIPMYSRNEMLNFSVNQYLNNAEFRKRGYI